MIIKGKVYCLFEQSGVFKNEFRGFGIPAFDYDIRNNYGQTDFQVDLFCEIEKAYKGNMSIFDKITSDDLIMAFFPCIYFCDNNMLIFCGLSNNDSNKRKEDFYEYILQRSKNRQYFYELLLKLFAIVEKKNIRMILENPSSAHHYLNNNFPFKPAFVDRNRMRRGDYFVKPTSYWFVNCHPTNGETFLSGTLKKTIRNSRSSGKGGICSEERSLLSPIYAHYFICDFILGKTQKYSQLSLFV